MSGRKSGRNTAAGEGGDAMERVSSPMGEKTKQDSPAEKGGDDEVVTKVESDDAVVVTDSGQKIYTDDESGRQYSYNRTT